MSGFLYEGMAPSATADVSMESADQPAGLAASAAPHVLPGIWPVLPECSTVLPSLRLFLRLCPMLVEGHVQAYVGWLDGGTAVFAFRGTESGKDAQTDADARTRHIPWMEGLFPKTRGHAGTPLDTAAASWCRDEPAARSWTHALESPELHLATLKRSV